MATIVIRGVEGKHGPAHDGVNAFLRATFLAILKHAIGRKPQSGTVSSRKPVKRACCPSGSDLGSSANGQKPWF